jgi:SAM-dependent methyltransferase
MENKSPDILEKIRQQYETSPYPRTPLEKSPQDDLNSLFMHNLVTPYYLNYQKVINPEDKVILDAGCGSGYKSLILGHANPGAKIVGIDISDESVNLARQRLHYHKFENVEFHVLSIYDLPNLGLEFDYINADEMLYLLPDVVGALQAMKSVLKPQGIIRTNLHSSLQRAAYFQAQELFALMGLTEGNPEDLEVEVVKETMKALKDGVSLKVKTWNSHYEKAEKEVILMNHLLQSDKGYTIPEMFSLLRAADLDFLNMVYWRYWEVTDLFKEPENLPVVWVMGLPEISLEERLHLYELLHPVHRLLDFWCIHPSQTPSSVIPVKQWQASDWQGAWVHLHPQLKTSQVWEDLIQCIKEQKPFVISRYITVPTLNPVEIDSTVAACLLPLWQEPQPVRSLVERWLKMRPLHPVTLESVSKETAFEEIKQLLSKLEVFLYLLLQRCP